jgi:very-short-patch-repair endonuclease
VVTVVELDDASHRRADRQHADERQRKAVESAGLRLIQIPTGPIQSGGLKSC